MHLGVQSLVNVPSDATITANSLAPELRTVLAQQFTANGTGTTFVLSAPPISSNSVIVTANGVVQWDYSVSGSTIITNFTPAAGTLIRAAGMGNILTTGTITDDSVSTAKLQTSSVTTAKIAALSVTGDKLGATSINANNIVSGSVTGDKLGLTAINANNIVDSTITGTKITANTITGDKVALASLSGNVIVANTITTNLFSSTIYASNSDILGITANGNTFSNTIIIFEGNTSSISVGDIVVGSNIAPNTVVLSFNSPPANRSNITVSNSLAGSNTNTAISFYSSRKILSPGIAGPGLAKAWVNFNGTGAVQIRAAYNVSSITDNGTGDYTVNFTTAMPDANYTLTASGGRGSGGSDPRFVGLNQANPTTSAARITVKQDEFVGLNDVEYVCCSFFR